MNLMLATVDLDYFSHVRVFEKKTEGSRGEGLLDRLVRPVGVKLRTGKISHVQTVIFFQQGSRDRSQIIYLTVGKADRLLYGYRPVRNRR
jgi:hypothetical protein